MASSEKPRQFCMKSQLILIARGLSINDQNLVDLLFQPLTRKHEIRGDAFSKSLSMIGCSLMQCDWFYYEHGGSYQTPLRYH